MFLHVFSFSKIKQAKKRLYCCTKSTKWFTIANILANTTEKQIKHAKTRAKRSIFNKISILNIITKPLKSIKHCKMCKHTWKLQLFAQKCQIWYYLNFSYIEEKVEFYEKKTLLLHVFRLSKTRHIKTCTKWKSFSKINYKVHNCKYNSKNHWKA